MALMRVAARPILILVATMLVVGGVITPAPASDDSPPELARLQREIDILIDRAVEYREEGEHEYGIGKLQLAITYAQRAMQEFGVEKASFYRLIVEAQASVVACARALDAILYQMDSEVRNFHVDRLDDPSVRKARQIAESLQSVPGTADGLVLDLRIDLRAYIAALYSQPLRKYLEPEAEEHLQFVVDTIGQEVDQACRTGSLDEARALIDHARFRGEEVIEAAQAAKRWTDLVYNTGMDVELAGHRATVLRQRVEGLDRDVAEWESALALLDTGETQRLEQMLIEAREKLLPTLLEQTMLTVELDDVYGWGLTNLQMLDTELYFSTKDDMGRDWVQSAQAIVDGVVVEIENLENLTAQVERSRAVLRDLRIWIDQFQGPANLGFIDDFLAEVLSTVFDLRGWKLQVDNHLERGRQCVENLARGAAPSSTPPMPITSPAAVGSPAPVAPTPPARPTGVPPPPAPVPTLPPPSSIQPDVAGGLKITGPSRIGVGWTVTLVATDHGGRPAVGVSWHSLSDNIQLHDDGTVKGLATGPATVMATVDGMRAFFDFEVVADGGAPAAPGGPPSLVTPLPDVAVVPSVSPTPIPVPPSTPPTPADARTTDWPDPDPAPSSWESDEDGGSRVDDASPTTAAAGSGGGFEDLGTEVGVGDEPAERSSPTTGAEAPSLPGEIIIEETAEPDTSPRISDAPEAAGGFENLGIEVGRPDDQAPPADREQPGQGITPMGAEATEPSPPQAPAQPPGPTDPPPTGHTGSTSDEPSTTPPVEPAGLNFMGVEVGQMQAPTGGSGGAIPLLPPPGSDDSRASGTPPPGGAPPPPDDDRRPFVPQRVNVTGAGQPAAYHIFATCSRLGWAGALARYSVGPADTAIADHLLVAGEHAMWANRTSYPPTPAWPGWQARRGLWGDWAARLAQTRDPVFRGQMANSLTTAHEPLAQSLAVQTVGDTYRTPSCDAEYCRLGFLMAWGQQALAISEEAQRNGNSQVAQAAAIDGRQRLRLARDRLPGYQRIIPASGRCADLTSIGGQLEAAIGGPSTAAARAAWETALRAIMALAGESPVRSAAGGSASASSSSGRCPVVHFNGEIEGDWTWGYCGLRFSRVGDEWVGALIRINDAMWDNGHRAGEPYYRLRRTGPLTYQGKLITKWGDGGVLSEGDVTPVNITVIMAGQSHLLRAETLVSGGMYSRNFDDSCKRPNLPSLSIGCAQTQNDQLECSVECDSDPYLEEDPTSGPDKLRQQGYPLIVFGPATLIQTSSWILEHADQPLCLDSLSPPSGADEWRPPAPSGPPPSGGLGDMQMMGVEGPGDTRAGLERAACEAAGLTQANCCGDWNGPCPDGTTGCHRVWRCD